MPDGHPAQVATGQKPSEADSQRESANHVDHQALEDRVRRVRKQGCLSVTGMANALQLIRCAEKTCGYYFSSDRAVLTV